MQAEQTRRSSESLGQTRRPDELRGSDLTSEVARLIRGEGTARGYTEGEGDYEAPAGDAAGLGTSGADGDADAAADDASARRGAADDEAAEPEGEAVEGEAGSEAERAAPATWDELAEYLELKPAELYSIAVPFKDHNGEARELTIGQLKDRMRDLVQLEEEREQFTERREATTLKLADAERRLVRLLEMAGRSNVPPNLWDAVEADLQARQRREALLVQSAEPDFADPVKREKLLGLIAKTMAPFGFEPEELAVFTDSRAVRAMLAFARMTEERRAARERVRQAPAVRKLPASTESAPVVRTEQRGGSGAQQRKREQLSRVSHLLRGR